MTIFGLCLTVISLLMVKIVTYSGDGVMLSSTGIDQIRFVTESSTEDYWQPEQLQLSNNYFLDTPIENYGKDLLSGEYQMTR